MSILPLRVRAGEERAPPAGRAKWDSFHGGQLCKDRRVSLDKKFQLIVVSDVYVSPAPFFLFLEEPAVGNINRTCCVPSARPLPFLSLSHLLSDGTVSGVPEVHSALAF